MLYSKTEKTNKQKAIHQHGHYQREIGKHTGDTIQDVVKSCEESEEIENKTRLCTARKTFEVWVSIPPVVIV